MSSEYEELFATLTQEYIEASIETVIKLGVMVDDICDGGVDRGNLFRSFMNEVHTIKGSAGSFGFQIVSMIAHRLEDYLESSRRLNYDQWQDVHKFIDEIHKIFQEGVEPNKEERSSILSKLPQAMDLSQPVSDKVGLNVLVVMPRDVIRTAVSRTLVSNGHNVSYANDTLTALGLVLQMQPDMIISRQLFNTLTGADLYKVLTALDQTKTIPFALLTTNDGLRADDLGIKPDSEGAFEVVKINANITRNIMAYVEAIVSVREVLN